jgi:hypothetical protein
MSPFITAYDYTHYLALSKFILPTVKERLAQLKSNGEKQLPLFDLKKVISISAPAVLILSLSYILTRYRTITSSGPSPTLSPTRTQKSSTPTS